MICYKKLFSKEGIINNIGCYIIISILILHIISIFIFYIKQVNKMRSIILDIIYSIKNKEIE